MNTKHIDFFALIVEEEQKNGIIRRNCSTIYRLIGTSYLEVYEEDMWLGICPKVVGIGWVTQSTYTMCA